ncbi:hypothetical protein STRIP9103_04427 [Streptomyces ipomoeae 91-03]|uniref:Uncharacterized protein n=1 Tax=Streptomyces ipomoeae 91-03 TaxID=698759 RepID=L1KVT4_9ACTN|nr:hypothetical protein STRIP9103_04427 [Streptomyces ipomoeae 91-03]
MSSHHTAPAREPARLPSYCYASHHVYAFEYGVDVEGACAV